MLVFNANASETSTLAIGGSVPEISAAYMVQMVLSLVFVIACIIALTWLIKRMQYPQGSSASAFRILASLNVGARERVILIQLGEQQILVGVAPGRVQTLHVLEEPIDFNVRRREVSDVSFAQRLKVALDKRGEKD